MKQFTIIYRDENGNLQERVFFAATSKEVKSINGFVAITKTERVKHPSPEIMQRAILNYQEQPELLNLPNFYATCRHIENEMKEVTENV